jgi:hypothetical protein
MKLGTEQALFPVVPNNAADSLRDALLDGKIHARAIVEKLWVDGRIVLGGRGEAHGAGALLVLLPRAGWVHDNRF